MVVELRHVGSCWEVPGDLQRFVEFARALEAAVQPTSGNDHGAEKMELDISTDLYAGFPSGLQEALSRSN